MVSKQNDLAVLQYQGSELTVSDKVENSEWSSFDKV